MQQNVKKLKQSPSRRARPASRVTALCSALRDLLTSGRVSRLLLASLLTAALGGPLAGCGEGGGGGGSAEAGEKEGSSAKKEPSEAEERRKEEAARAVARRREEVELASIKKKREAAAKAAETSGSTKKKSGKGKRAGAGKRARSGKRGKKKSAESPAEETARKQFQKEEAQEAALFKKREREERGER